MLNVYYLPYLVYANSQIRDKREQSIENSTFFVYFDNVYLKSFELVYLSTHNAAYNYRYNSMTHMRLKRISNNMNFHKKKEEFVFNVRSYLSLTSYICWSE